MNYLGTTYRLQHLPLENANAYAVIANGLCIGHVFEGDNEWVAGSRSAKTVDHAARILVGEAMNINPYAVAVEIDSYNEAVFVGSRAKPKVWKTELQDVDINK